MIGIESKITPFKVSYSFCIEYKNSKTAWVIGGFSKKPVIYTDPPQSFEKGDLTPTQTLENLNFYFGRFSINSGEIVIFQRKLKSKNAKIA